MADFVETFRPAAKMVSIAGLSLQFKQHAQLLHWLGGTMIRALELQLEIVALILAAGLPSVTPSNLLTDKP